MRKTETKGFTLIELLIVVAIIAILAAIAIPNFLEAKTRSGVSKLLADMKTLGMAEEMYHVEHGAYHPCYGTCPWDEARANGPCAWFLYASGGGCGLSGPFLTTPIAFINTIPIDPFMSRYVSKLQPFGGDRSVLYRQAYNRVHRNFAIGSPTGQVYVSVKQVGWTMRSPGPNLLIWGYDVETVYDPTNGTVSNGDIWYLGKGRGFVGGGGNFDQVRQRF